MHDDSPIVHYAKKKHRVADFITGSIKSEELFILLKSLKPMFLL